MKMKLFGRLLISIVLSIVLVAISAINAGATKILGEQCVGNFNGFHMHAIAAGNRKNTTRLQYVFSTYSSVNLEGYGNIGKIVPNEAVYFKGRKVQDKNGEWWAEIIFANYQYKKNGKPTAMTGWVLSRLLTTNMNGAQYYLKNCWNK